MLCTDCSWWTVWPIDVGVYAYCYFAVQYENLWTHSGEKIFPVLKLCLELNKELWCHFPCVMMKLAHKRTKKRQRSSVTVDVAGRGGGGQYFPWLLWTWSSAALGGNKRTKEHKEIPSCSVSCLQIVYTWQLEILWKMNGIGYEEITGSEKNLFFIFQ